MLGQQRWENALRYSFSLSSFLPKKPRAHILQSSHQIPFYSQAALRAR